MMTNIPIRKMIDMPPSPAAEALGQGVGNKETHRALQSEKVSTAWSSGGPKARDYAIAHCRRGKPRRHKIGRNCSKGLPSIARGWRASGLVVIEVVDRVQPRAQDLVATQQVAQIGATCSCDRW